MAAQDDTASGDDGMAATSDDAVIEALQIENALLCAENAALLEWLADLELLAGQSVGLVNEIKPAGKIVLGMMGEAKRIIETLGR